MTDNIEAWWARRQFSKGVAVPYEVGAYRAEWQPYPALVRQYHSDLNAFITLTQIPPAADVYLTWQCDVGHVFVATPEEQRNRPGRTRRRSSWCPECSAGAVRPRIRARDAAAEPLAERTGDGAAAAPLASTPSTPAPPTRPRRPTAVRSRTEATPTALPTPGEAFHSTHAPAPASAAEARLRQLLAARIPVDPTLNAVRVGRPFFGRLEVWPDILLPDLRVAIEYDTIGRFGLEHVGKREAADRRKDALLRAARWEVVRIRCGKLQPLGPYDLSATAVSAKLVERLIEALRDIRGDLFVNAYLLPPPEAPTAAVAADADDGRASVNRASTSLQ